MVRNRIRLLLPLAGLLGTALGTAACADEDSDPAGPDPGVVLLDTTSTIPAVAGARDTIDVTVPEGRTMGLIMETNVPIVARYGSGAHDVVWSGFGGAFAAVVPQVGTGNIRLLMHRSEAAIEQVDYRLRVIAVNEAPEHAEQMIAAGDAFRREFIDPPLDLDVFAVDFEDGDRFFVELETGGDDPQLTMGVLPPAGASFYAFIAAGPERARSEVFQTDVDGQHLLIVYSTGLSPDVEQSYRFRIVPTEEPASVVLHP